MTIDDLKKMYENGNIFEIKTGLSHGNWHNWIKKLGYIPIQSQIKLESITNGLLKASLDDLPNYRNKEK